jgi:hypothetical protein
MRRIKHDWRYRLCLALLLVIGTVGHAAEPRLMQLFRKLEAGEPQVVVVYGTSLTLYGQWAVAL